MCSSSIMDLLPYIPLHIQVLYYSTWCWFHMNHFLLAGIPGTWANDTCSVLRPWPCSAHRGASRTRSYFRGQKIMEFLRITFAGCRTHCCVHRRQGKALLCRDAVTWLYRFYSLPGVTATVFLCVCLWEGKEGEGLRVCVGVFVC